MEENGGHKKWTVKLQEIQQLVRDGLSLEEIAEKYETTPYNLNQVIHRNGLFIIDEKNPSLAYKIIKTVFRNPQYFKPTREFYKATNISQQRWWTLYRGEDRMTEEEFRNIALHLDLTLHEAYDLRGSGTSVQTNFLDQLETKDKK